MTSLRVAVYYPWVYLTGGAERIILEFGRRSRHKVTVFTNAYRPEQTFPGIADLDVVVLPPVPLKRSILSVATAGTRILRQKIDLRDYDLLLILGEGLGDFVALRHENIPILCICLTPLRIVFDPVYRARYLSARGFGYRSAIGVAGSVFRWIDRLAWQRYRRVFVISEEVRQRALAGKLASSDKLRVLHPGVDLFAFKPDVTRSAERQKVFFVPGRIMWTKNLELAINAFREFRATVGEGEQWRLVIAGIVDGKSEPYLAQLRELAGSDESIEFRTQVSDAEMLECYRSCFATLFTAFNEDWGLVLIEAMACGTPVVATNRGGPREILRHGHDGLLADATPASFAHAMVRLVREPDLGARLAANGPTSAERFGWQSFVEEIDTTLEAEAAAATARAPRSSRRELLYGQH